MKLSGIFNALAASALPLCATGTVGFHISGHNTLSLLCGIYTILSTIPVALARWEELEGRSSSKAPSIN